MVIVLSKGKRPSKPRSFETPGMTRGVWKIAKKCWHEKARERPHAGAVFQDLEKVKIANTGTYTHETYFFLPWELINSGVEVDDKREPQPSVFKKIFQRGKVSD